MLMMKRLSLKCPGRGLQMDGTPTFFSTCRDIFLLVRTLPCVLKKSSKTPSPFQVTTSILYHGICPPPSGPQRDFLITRK